MKNCGHLVHIHPHRNSIRWRLCRASLSLAWLPRCLENLERQWLIAPNDMDALNACAMPCAPPSSKVMVLASPSWTCGPPVVLCVHPDPAVVVPPLATSLSISFSAAAVQSLSQLRSPFAPPSVDCSLQHQILASYKRPIFCCPARSAFLHLAG
jgi:hypothetical protein